MRVAREGSNGYSKVDHQHLSSPPPPTIEDLLGGKPPLSPRRSYSPVSLAPLSHFPPYPVPLAPDGVGCYVAFAVTSSEGECPVSVERHSAQKDEDGES